MARRMSVKDRIQVSAASSSSSTSMNVPSSGSVVRPASSRASMTSAAAAALPSRRVLSVNRRKSPAASSSSGYAVGNSRASTGSSGSVVGPEKSSSCSSGSCCVLGGGRLVAQQLDQLARQRTQQVGLEGREGGDAGAAAPVTLEAGHGASAFCIVAHRPYSCMACTSRSIASRVPVETTDRPSSCTSIISFSAFFLA